MDLPINSLLVKTSSLSKASYHRSEHAFAEISNRSEVQDSEAKLPDTRSKIAWSVGPKSLFRSRPRLVTCELMEVS